MYCFGEKRDRKAKKHNFTVPRLTNDKGMGKSFKEGNAKKRINFSGPRRSSKYPLVEKWIFGKKGHDSRGKEEKNER